MQENVCILFMTQTFKICHNTAEFNTLKINVSHNQLNDKTNS